MPLINSHAEESSKTRGLNLGLGLYQGFSYLSEVGTWGLLNFGKKHLDHQSWKNDDELDCNYKLIKTHGYKNYPRKFVQKCERKHVFIHIFNAIFYFGFS